MSAHGATIITYLLCLTTVRHQLLNFCDLSIWPSGERGSIRGPSAKKEIIYPVLFRTRLRVCNDSIDCARPQINLHR